MAERDDFGAFLVGFLVGGLTGAVVALLFAPQAGEKTRVIIRDKAIELKDKASENVDSAYAQAEAAAAEARARFEELAQITRERADELRQRGQVVLEEQKNKVTEVIAKTPKSSASEPAEGEAAI